MTSRRRRRVLLAAALSLLAALAFATPTAALEPLAEIGTSGSGAGQLDDPAGVATGEAGELFVAESGNHRVSQFTTKGGFVRTLGSAGGSALAFPGGVTTGEAGELFVAESGNHRVSQFTTQGDFVRAFGFDVVPGGGTGFEVCTAATGCKGGVSGGGAGQLSNPWGVAADGSGSLYVAESVGGRVSQFTAQGGFVRAFGFDVVPGGGTGFEVCTAATGCKVGVQGGGAGQLNFPRGVATDGSGSLYVAEAGNGRVSRFTTQGDFVRAFGFDVVPGGGTGFEVCTAATGCKAASFGGGAGQLWVPEGVATDESGNVYVGDSGNHRVSQFTTQGDFVRAFGFDVVPGGGTGFEVCTTGTGCRGGTLGGAVGQLARPTGVAADCRGAIYVAEGDGDRVQRFGEPGTPLPPCPSGEGQPPPNGAPPPNGLDPSNEFSFGKVRKNKQRGTAKLKVEVPGSGAVLLAQSRKVKGREARAEAAGEVTLPVKPRGKAKRKLAEKGKAKVKAEVTYRPDGGDPNTKTKRLKLLKRSRK